MQLTVLRYDESAAIERFHPKVTDLTRDPRAFEFAPIKGANEEGLAPVMDVLGAVLPDIVRSRQYADDFSVDVISLDWDLQSNTVFTEIHLKLNEALGVCIDDITLLEAFDSTPERFPEHFAAKLTESFLGELTARLGDGVSRVVCNYRIEMPYDCLRPNGGSLRGSIIRGGPAIPETAGLTTSDLFYAIRVLAQEADRKIDTHFSDQVAIQIGISPAALAHRIGKQPSFGDIGLTRGLHLQANRPMLFEYTLTIPECRSSRQIGEAMQDVVDKTCAEVRGALGSRKDVLPETGLIEYQDSPPYSTAFCRRWLQDVLTSRGQPASA